MSDNFVLSITPIKAGGANFIASTASEETDVLSMTAIGGYVLYLQNTSTTKVIDIKKIMASASTPGGVLRWSKNVMVERANNFIQQEPVNINGKGEAEAVCYRWDGIENGIAGISEGEKVKTYILDIGYTPIETNATLGLFDNIALHFKHPEGMPDFECGIQFSYREIEPPEVQDE